MDPNGVKGIEETHSGRNLRNANFTHHVEIDIYSISSSDCMGKITSAKNWITSNTSTEYFWLSCCLSSVGLTPQQYHTKKNDVSLINRQKMSSNQHQTNG
ncbi:unnamed protein product [Lepeophtheirus salmonis]|uniref:(salmon louse) hypothetical protein n=1 Tax=Lepeophtheirus salmonis TaxID=72036 RepID=A0A7R8H1S5_LEPSM|nr:unnamed protein product [Lepeophtheirus salmonis]CAF2817055.1 unnamed protein product [Lepeophtheirus salmonis]